MNATEPQLGCLELRFSSIYKIPNDAVTSKKSIIPPIAMI